MYFSFKIDESGKVLDFDRDEYREYLRTLSAGKYFLAVRKNIPDPVWKLPHLKRMHGDFGMLSKALGENYSPEDIKAMCKRMWPERFVIGQKIDFLTGKQIEVLRSFTDRYLTEEDFYQFTSIYRARWNQLFEFGDQMTRPLKDVFNYVRLPLPWYSDAYYR